MELAAIEYGKAFYRFEAAGMRLAGMVETTPLFRFMNECEEKMRSALVAAIDEHARLTAELSELRARAADGLAAAERVGEISIGGAQSPEFRAALVDLNDALARRGDPEQGLIGRDPAFEERIGVISSADIEAQIVYPELEQQRREFDPLNHGLQHWDDGDD